MQKRRLSWEWWILALCCAIGLCMQVFAHEALPASATEKPITLPILMYHSLLKHPIRANDYTVSPDVFAADLEYLLTHGYQTIWMQELIDYVYEGKALPKKPVIITFDDGHLNNLTYALPILQERHAKAVLSVVGAYVEQAECENDPNPQYAYVTWQDIRTLQASGCFEIQNHSHNMHQVEGRMGITRKAGEALANYESVLLCDVLRMQQALHDNAGLTPNTFTYPFGFVDHDAERILCELGFRATLACYERKNLITRNPGCLFSLGRYNRPAGLSTARFMKKALGE
ncbi:MAG: polysaccharide deacetylase family protein [Clostridia bacterium]